MSVRPLVVGTLAMSLAFSTVRCTKTVELNANLIRGAVTLSGVFKLAMGESQSAVFGTDPEVRRDASPLFHITPSAPPFLVTYCQWDYLRLPAQAKKF